MKKNPYNNPDYEKEVLIHGTFALNHRRQGWNEGREVGKVEDWNEAIEAAINMTERNPKSAAICPRALLEALKKPASQEGV